MCSKEYKIRVSVDRYLFKIFSQIPSRFQGFDSKIIDEVFIFNN